MDKIKEIVISVRFEGKGGRILTCAEVGILIEENQNIRAQDLVDACQRSVAYCVDELKKDVDLHNKF